MQEVYLVRQVVPNPVPRHHICKNIKAYSSVLLLKAADKGN